MWKFASKNSSSQGLLKRAPTLPKHFGIAHLMMAPPKLLKVLQVTSHVQSRVMGGKIQSTPAQSQQSSMHWSTPHSCAECLCLLCTTMHNLIPTQCWTLEIFQFTCDSIIANLFFSPFHTMDCGNWSAYTSKQAGMHLANIRWCFLRA